MAENIISTKEEVKELLSLYDWDDFNSYEKTLQLWDDDYDEHFCKLEYVVDGEALVYLLERETEDEE
jgi:hypothetical protein